MIDFPLNYYKFHEFKQFPPELLLYSLCKLLHSPPLMWIGDASSPWKPLAPSGLPPWTIPRAEFTLKVMFNLEHSLFLPNLVANGLILQTWTASSFVKQNLEVNLQQPRFSKEKTALHLSKESLDHRFLL